MKNTAGASSTKDEVKRHKSKAHKRGQSLKQKPVDHLDPHVGACTFLTSPDLCFVGWPHASSQQSPFLDLLTWSHNEPSGQCSGKPLRAASACRDVISLAQRACALGTLFGLSLIALNQITSGFPSLLLFSVNSLTLPYAFRSGDGDRGDYNFLLAGEP